MVTKSLNTIDGLNFSSAKRLVDFAFSESLFKMEKNDNNHSFDVYLKETAELKVIKNFTKKYPCFDFYYVSFKKIDK